MRVSIPFTQPVIHSPGLRRMSVFVFLVCLVLCCGRFLPASDVNSREKTRAERLAEIRRRVQSKGLSFEVGDNPASAEADPPPAAEPWPRREHHRHTTATTHSTPTAPPTPPPIAPAFGPGGDGLGYATADVSTRNAKPVRCTDASLVNRSRTSGPTTTSAGH